MPWMPNLSFASASRSEKPIRSSNKKLSPHAKTAQRLIFVQSKERHFLNWLVPIFKRDYLPTQSMEAIETKRAGAFWVIPGFGWKTARKKICLRSKPTKEAQSNRWETSNLHAGKRDLFRGTIHIEGQPTPGTKSTSCLSELEP